MLTQRLFILFLPALLVSTLTLPAFAERASPNSITARVFAGPNEGGLGLGYTRDFVVPLRVGVAGGFFGAGDGSNNWQLLHVDARLREGSSRCFVVPTLFVGVGAARFYDFRAPDGNDSYRETFAATLGLTGELRPHRDAAGGLVVSVGAYGAWALVRDVEDAPQHKVWDKYALTPLAMPSLGYGF
jgi:hypothetical protein